MPGYGSGNEYYDGLNLLFDALMTKDPDGLFIEKAATILADSLEDACKLLKRDLALTSYSLNSIHDAVSLMIGVNSVGLYREDGKPVTIKDIGNYDGIVSAAGTKECILSLNQKKTKKSLIKRFFLKFKRKQSFGLNSD